MHSQAELSAHMRRQKSGPLPLLSHRLSFPQALPLSTVPLLLFLLSLAAPVVAFDGFSASLAKLKSGATFELLYDHRWRYTMVNGSKSHMVNVGRDKRTVYLRDNGVDYALDFFTRVVLRNRWIIDEIVGTGERPVTGWNVGSVKVVDKNDKWGSLKMVERRKVWSWAMGNLTSEMTEEDRDESTVYLRCGAYDEHEVKIALDEGMVMLKTQGAEFRTVLNIAASDYSRLEYWD